MRFLCVINRHACCKRYDATRCCYWRGVDNDAMRRLDAMCQNQQHDAIGSTCSRTVDTNIGCLLGRLSMIRVKSPDAFVYPRINRLEMPGTEPKLLRPGEPTPIMLSVNSSLIHIVRAACCWMYTVSQQCHYFISL